MVDPIQSITGTLSSSELQESKSIKDGQRFKDLLNNSLEEVNNLQIEADQLSQDFALGKVDNIHEVTIATEKARLALNLTLAIQNKVVDAYNKIMRMQV